MVIQPPMAIALLLACHCVLLSAGFSFITNTDSSITFDVFRAVTTSSPYATKLTNVNAGDAAGALKYLHDEVVPFDMIETADCQRKFGIDAIARFRVTVKNPGAAPGQLPNLAGFAAYDSGVCTATPALCGTPVGYQTQAPGARGAYDAYWFSFNQKGLCDHPTGAQDCTYSYALVGMVKIDELVGITQGFNAFCQQGHKEYERVSRQDTCSTYESTFFWRDQCDLDACARRVKQLISAHFVYPSNLPTPAPEFPKSCLDRCQFGERNGTEICPDRAGACCSKCSDGPQCRYTNCFMGFSCSLSYKCEDSVPTPAPETCIKDNSDYNGGDLRPAYQVVSVNRCLEICVLAPDCDKFAYVPAALTCYLKDSTAGPARVSANGVQAGTRACWTQPTMPPTVEPPTPLATAGCMFKNSVGGAEPYTFMDNVFAAEACQFLCSEDPACHTFAWVQERTSGEYKRCNLYNVSSELVASECCVAGHVRDCKSLEGYTTIQIDNAPLELPQEAGTEFIVAVQQHSGLGCEAGCFGVVQVRGKQEAAVYGNGIGVMDRAASSLVIVVRVNDPIVGDEGLQFVVYAIDSATYLASPSEVAIHSVFDVKASFKLGPRLLYKCKLCPSEANPSQCCEDASETCHNAPKLGTCCLKNHALCLADGDMGGGECYNPLTETCCTAGIHSQACTSKQHCWGKDGAAVCTDAATSACTSCPNSHVPNQCCSIASEICLRDSKQQEGYCCHASSVLCLSQDLSHGRCFDPKSFKCCPGKSVMSLCELAYDCDSGVCVNPSVPPITPPEGCSLSCPSIAAPDQCCGGDDVCDRTPGRQDGICCEKNEQVCGSGQGKSCFEPTIANCCNGNPCYGTCVHDECIGNNPPTPSPAQRVPCGSTYCDKAAEVCHEGGVCCLKSEDYCYAGGSGGKCYKASAHRCCASGVHTTLCPHTTTCRAVLGALECIDLPAVAGPTCPGPSVSCVSTNDPLLCCGADEQCLTVKDPLNPAALPSHSYCCAAKDSLCHASGKVRSVDGGVCMVPDTGLTCCQDQEKGLWGVCEAQQKCGVQSGRMLCELSAAAPTPTSSPDKPAPNNTVLIVIIAVVAVSLVIGAVVMYKRRRGDANSSLRMQAALLDDGDLDDPSGIYTLGAAN